MRVGRFRKLAALVSVSALLLVACGDSSTPSTPTDPGQPTDPTTPTDPGPTDPGTPGRDTVTIGMRGDIHNTDLMRRASIDDIGILMNIYDEHTRRNQDGSVGPGLIESWEANDDATEWTFTLREGVVFHNGEPVTSEDLKFSIERSRDLGEAVSQYWASVEEVEVLDELSVRLSLSSGNALQMQSGELAIIPKAYFEEVGDQGFQEAPIGAGPYKFVEWRPDQHLMLEAFEDYWDGPPAIQNVIFRSIPDDAARAAAYRAGEIDIAMNLTVEDYLSMEADPNLGVEIIFAAPRNFINIDNNRAPMDDVRVRKALNHAINWDLIIEQILEGMAQRTPVVAIPEEIGFTPDLEPYAYDPDLARSLLAEAGHADGIDVDFVVRLGYVKGDEVTSAIQAQLADVGIRATIRTVDNAEYGTLAAENNVGHIAFSGYTGDGSYVGHAWHLGRSVCGPTASRQHGLFYCNDEVIEPLLDEAMTYFATDLERARAAIQEMERTIYDDAAIVFGYQRPNLWGVANDLNWEPSAFGYMLMFFASW